MTLVPETDPDGTILASRRAVPHLCGLTDATAGAGAPDGRYRLGSLGVTRGRGAMRPDDGTLAGSRLTMARAPSKILAIGLPLAEASRRLSGIHAGWSDAPRIGHIGPGAHADLLVLDAGLSLRHVLIGGADLPFHSD